MSLIESRLEHTRIESGRLITHPEPLDLGGLAAEVVAEMRPQAEHKGLPLTLSVLPDLTPLEGDRRLVSLILVNLIGNAMEPVRDKRTPGVGLGLSLVRELLDALGGRIELSSAVGMGSTFTVLLPSTAAALRACGRLKSVV